MPKVKTVAFETTLLVRDTCLCLHVQRAARSLARRFDEALRPYGLTSGQFSLLMSLNRPDPPAIKDVADLLAMDRTTLTAALKPLTRNGWVKITPSKTDKRSKQLSLTAKGMAVLASAVPVWKKEQAALDKMLDAGALRAGLVALF